MAEGVNVRLTDKLQDFVSLKTDSDQAVFTSASEYIRDLIRHDMEREESRKGSALKTETSAGVEADESEILATYAAETIPESKRCKAGD